ncbi:hypothetical protein [Halodesulfovibrio sp.]|jgi:hypothetical protein|uniref:hypothetical protein n=1 Tax=Halodesulfovibrio sp. TaxID=1912772 RepID=UPI0025F7833F|nr:hypothetical protein [Halodesulfovibrio sp.]MCT4627929.1 hypothetical protein [Halodesulfovibrio sp.]
MQFDIREQYEISPMRNEISFEEFERRWNSDEPVPQQGGLLNTIGALGSTFAEGVEQVAPAFARDYRGGDIPHPSSRGLLDNYIIKSRQDAAEHMQKYRGQGSAEHIAKTPESLGFSGASALSGVVASGAGLALSGGNPVAAGAAGTVASGATAYRIAKDMFMEETLNQFNEESMQDRGHGLTEEEWENAKENLDDLGTEHGLWEALPELFGNVAGAGIVFAPAKKVLGETLAKNVLTRLTGKGAEMFGTEIVTEAITEQGQHNLAVDSGLLEGEHRELADFGESVKGVAAQTALQVAMTGGLGSGVKGLHRLTSRKAGQSADVAMTGEESLDPNKSDQELTGEGNKENTPQDAKPESPADSGIKSTVKAEGLVEPTPLTSPEWDAMDYAEEQQLRRTEEENRAFDVEWSQREREHRMQNIPEERRFEPTDPLSHLRASPEQQLKISQEEAMLETRGLPMPTGVVNDSFTKVLKGKRKVF